MAEALERIITGWAIDLEKCFCADRTRAVPIKEGEPVLLFQDAGDGDNQMLVFAMPRSDEQPLTARFNSAGRSPCVHEDLYSVTLYGPALRGYRMTERYGIVSPLIAFFKEKGGSLLVSDEILEFDSFILAIGQRSIYDLMKRAVEDSVLCDEYHLLEYLPCVKLVLSELKPIVLEEST